MAEREKFFRRETTIRELVAKKHPDDGSDGKCVENPSLFTGREPQTRQITEDQR